MGVEIERKFLVDREQWKAVDKGDGTYYQQGYLVTEPGKTIRVRISDTTAYLTIKGPTKEASRLEFEYEIPLEDARELLGHFAAASVSKIRYNIQVGEKVWEVDEFLEENSGLLLAEIELNDPGESFELPEWAGTEVTEDERYYNSRLAQNPFANWKQS